MSQTDHPTTVEVPPVQESTAAWEDVLPAKQGDDENEHNVQQEEKHGADGSGANSTLAGETDEKWKPSLRVWMILGNLMLLALIAAVDATALGAALVDVTADLEGTTVQAIWAGNSFLVLSTVFQPTIGSLSEIFGRLYLTMFSILMFFIGSIICAAAPNFSGLIAGRAVQGVGGGGILVMSEIIITDIIPLRQRGQYYSLLGAMWAIGTVVGPLLGGGFATNVTWRWIFWINLPFCGIALVTTPFFLRLHLEERNFMDKLREVDYSGIALFTAATTALLLGLTFGGVNFAWDSYHVVVPLVLGSVGLVALLFHQKFYAKHPMMRVQVFGTRSAFAGYIQVFFHGLILWCLIYFLPIFYQGTRGYSAIGSGLALLPESLVVAPMAIVGGILMTIFGKYVYLSWIAWACATAGLGLIALMDPNTTLGQLIGLNILFSVGAGILFASLNMSVIAPNTNENTPYAAAMLSFLRTLGNAFGLAIGGAIFANKVGDAQKTNPYMQGLGSASSQAVALVEIIRAMPEGAQKTALEYVLTDAVHLVMYVMIAFAGFSFLINIIVKEYSLDVHYESKQHVTDGANKTKEKDDNVV